MRTVLWIQPFSRPNYCGSSWWHAARSHSSSNRQYIWVTCLRQKSRGGTSFLQEISSPVLLPIRLVLIYWIRQETPDQSASENVFGAVHSKKKKKKTDWKDLACWNCCKQGHFHTVSFSKKEVVKGTTVNNVADPKQVHVLSTMKSLTEKKTLDSRCEGGWPWNTTEIGYRSASFQCQ